MTDFPLPANEVERLSALHRYNILDSPEDDDFQQIVELVAQVCDVPIALISLLDENRQWSKAKKGIEVDSVHRSIAPCTYAILEDDLMEVSDLTADERFANNPLVTGPPHIRFYAGISLATSDGYRLGTLCVMDQKVRELSSEQRFALKVLSRQVMKNMEVRFQMYTLSEKMEEITEMNQIISKKNQELHNAQEEIQSLNLDLEKKVEQRTQELDRSNHDLDTFLYRSSHDLMRPVTSLQGLVMLGKHTLKDKEALDLFQRVGKTAEGMKNLMSKLLQAHEVLSKPNTPEPTDLPTLMYRIQEELHQHLPGFNLLISSSSEGNEEQWITHQNLLYILLRNLAENAWHFRLKEGQKLMPTFRVHVQQEDHKVILTTHDNATGMPDEVKSAAFDMFYRGSNESQGNGLGLYLVAKAAEKMKGIFTFESVVGQGTTFTFRFPLSTALPTS